MRTRNVGPACCRITRRGKGDKGLVDDEGFRQLVIHREGNDEAGCNRGNVGNRMVGGLRERFRMKCWECASIMDTGSCMHKLEVVISISWNNFKFMMIQEFCPNQEMQKLESELWNHAMVGAGHATYTDRFHELARLVPHLISGALTDEAVRNGSIKKVVKRGNVGEPSKDKNGRGDNKRTRTGNIFATTVNLVGRENTGTWPKCTTCNSYHAPGGPCRTCFNCNHPGHLAKDCRGVPRNVNPVNARNPTVRYFAFGGHLDELHVTWAHLEKKRTRLRTNTKTRRFVLTEPGDGVTSHTRRRHNSSSDDVTSFMTASARTDSNADLEDSSYDGVTTKMRRRRVAQAKRLFGNEDVWVEMHRGIAWDKVENSDPQRTPVEVEPLDETQLEDLGLNTCNHDIPLSNREVPSFDEPEPQPNLLPNYLSLDVSLGKEKGPEPPFKPHSPDSFKIKEVDSLTINTPLSPHVASSYLKDTYCYYRPCIDDPKKHYRFKPGLLGISASLGVDISNWEMFDDDWGLESKEVSPLGKELSLFDRPNKVERGGILEAHRLEPILQQQISQRMAPSHHDGVYHYYHPHLNSSVGEPSPLSIK
ncbi:putative reverse transcriptase domain-containing protein [Tanacetum coccineum]|uniref:Reverse transcriptase domain-containing protein n=1 Tax=Tanacetum coccineum TaxID=301880 RepID=A0ABQ5FLL4_9ASTR